MGSKSASSGRPATFSRDEAIERAMQLFWRDGYLAVTARDLAGAMQIQRSSFYNSFGSKEAVFNEALERYAVIAPDAALERIGPDQAVTPVVIAALRDLCRVRAADRDARGCLVCNSVAELVNVDPEFGPKLESAVRARVAVVERLFRQAAERGEFAATAPPKQAAKAFVSFLLGINVMSKSERSEKALWGICETFLRGLGIEDRHLAAATGNE